MRTICLSIVAILVATLSANAQVTFTKDVAPILQERCQICHHPGTFAPMSLMTYDQARPWAKSIKEKILMREMPPWHIDKNVGVQRFSNDILSMCHGGISRMRIFSLIDFAQGL